MNRFKGGPELKMPELKVPDFLVDLYWDLRDRRLLPLVVLGLVAIVAVPFLLGGSSTKQASPPVGHALPGAKNTASRFAVVQANPGLRDYHKRLGHRSPTDPFVQRYTSPQLAGSELEKGEGEVSSETSTSGTTGGGGGGSSEGGSSGGGSAPPPNHLSLFSFAATIKITHTTTDEAGKKQTDKPEVRHQVLPPSSLPGEKDPLITYLGISPKTRQPLLLISDAVVSVFGEGQCLSGKDTCQLLEVETNLPITFVAANGDRYKIDILKVEPVIAGKY